ELEGAGGEERRLAASHVLRRGNIPVFAMSLNIRRIVTGHDERGRAVVAIDDICRNVISRRPQHESCVVWSTGSFPSDNSDALDGAARSVASTDPNGSVFRIVAYGPGVAPRNHRTESID